MKLDLGLIADLLQLKNFTNIDIELDGKTVVIYIDYPSEDEAENAYKILSKYIKQIREVAKG